MINVCLLSQRLCAIHNGPHWMYHIPKPNDFKQVKNCGNESGALEF